MADKNWYIIAYCERQDAWDNWIPAEWFIKDAPFSTREEAENHQARIVEDTKGTDAEWPEANASAKIVHRDELGRYGLKPFDNEALKWTHPSLGTYRLEKQDREGVYWLWRYDLGDWLFVYAEPGPRITREHLSYLTFIGEDDAYTYWR